MWRGNAGKRQRDGRERAAEIVHTKINVKLSVSGYVKADRKQKYTPKNTLRL